MLLATGGAMYSIFVTPTLLNLEGSNITLRLADTRTGLWDTDDKITGMDFYIGDGSASGPGIGGEINLIHGSGGGETAPRPALVFKTTDRADPAFPMIENLRIDGITGDITANTVKGNFGIGTATPTQKLEVSGSANITDTVFTNNVNISGNVFLNSSTSRIQFGSTLASSNSYIQRDGATVKISGRTGVYFAYNGVNKFYVHSAYTQPQVDNSMQLGRGNNRWSVVNTHIINASANSNITADLGVSGNIYGGNDLILTGRYFGSGASLGTATTSVTLNVGGTGIGAVNYYSGDGSLGATDGSNIWFCANSDCSNKCQADIKDGLIIGCA